MKGAPENEYFKISSNLAFNTAKKKQKKKVFRNLFIYEYCKSVWGIY